MNSFIKQAILAMSTDVVFCDLVDITYYDITGNATHYFYNNTDDEIELDGALYVPMSMSVQGGKREQDRIGDGSLSLSDIDRSWTERIRSTDKRPLCSHYECARYTDSNGESHVDIIEKTNYKLKDSSYNGETMSFTMCFDETMNIMIPVDEGNSQTTSGCC